MSSLAIAKCLLVLFALFGIFFHNAAAAPVADLDIRDVYVPPITYPQSGVVWIKGQDVTVTWNTSCPPQEITNRIGSVILRKGKLATPVILAKGFDILDGSVAVTVPWVEESDDYSIVLFGDSGNWSEQFTIKEST